MPTLVEAIDEKYNNTEEEESLEFIICVPKSSPRKRLPSVLVLENCNIDEAGSEQDILEKCGQVRELDLARNLLSSWDEVFKVVRQVQNLSFLNLSFNNLSSSTPVPDIRLDSLTQLVLNSTQIRWQNVFSLLQLASNLKELHLSLNDLTCERNLPAWVQPHKNLRTLYFNSNCVEHGDDLRFLDLLFPQLKHLYLVDCPLWTFLLSQEDAARLKLEKHHIQVSQSEANSSPAGLSSPIPSISYMEYHSRSPSAKQEKLQIFTHLKNLCVSNCHIESWEEIDSLNAWPALQELRLLTCPLFNGYTQHEKRQFTIARLPKITKLNGGLISAKEKEESERAFIRYYDSKPDRPKPARYGELLETHGPLFPLVELDLKPKTEVLVLIRWKELQVQRRITVYQTVGELKVKLREVAGLPLSRMRLFYVDQGMKGVFGPEEMKYPNKQLYSYNINDGDEFIVDAKS